MHRIGPSVCPCNSVTTNSNIIYCCTALYAVAVSEVQEHEHESLYIIILKWLFFHNCVIAVVPRNPSCTHKHTIVNGPFAKELSV